jgi:hypothetical protein
MIKEIYMNKTVYIKCFLFFISILALSGCRQDCTIRGIYVSEILVISAERLGYNYCELLENSLDGDTTAMNTLLTLEIMDAPSYDHGSVIVDLIQIIGEDNFIKYLKRLNPQKQVEVSGLILVGLEYGSNIKATNKKAAEIFPKIYAYYKLNNLSEPLWLEKFP